MTFKKLNEYSVKEIVDLWNDAFSDYLVPIKMSQSSFNNRMNNYQLSWDDSIVALVNDELAGVALVGTKTLSGNMISWIGGMGVKTKFREMGVADAMLTHIEKACNNNGVQSITLEVIVENDKAIRFYQKKDFQIISNLCYFQSETIDYHELPYKLKKLRKYDEDIAIPWQSKLVFGGKYYDIYDENMVIGVISYEEVIQEKKVTTIIIKNVIIEKADILKIKRLHQSFFNKYGYIKILYSNLAEEKAETKLLLSTGYRSITRQYQMKKEIGK